MQNHENAQAMEEASLNSAGSAAEENARQVDSLQGRINALTSAWQQFSNATMDSGLLKGFVSGLTGVLDVVTSIVDTFGALPMLIGLAGAALNFTDFKNILPIKTIEDASKKYSGKSFESPWLNVFNAVKNMGDFDDVKFSFSENLISPTDVQLVENFNRALREGQGVGAAYNDVMIRGSQYAQQFVSELNVAGRAVGNVADRYDNFAKKKNVAIQAQDHSLKNAKELIAGFNDESMRNGLSKAEYSEAVMGSWREMGIHMENVRKSGDAAKASMKGFIGTLVASKAAMIGVEVAAMAMNAAITMGISVLVSWAFSKLSEIIETSEELSQRVDDITGKYKEQREAFNDAKSVVDEVAPSNGSISRYEELSKGVNSLGKNISLTADEYDEYNEIVGRIATTFPSLVKGYNDQGNAILSCKGNVEELTKAYEKMGHDANNEIINNSKDVERDFRNSIKEANSRGFWNMDFNLDDADILKKILESDDIDAATREYASESSYSIAKALQDKGIIGEDEDINGTENRLRLISDAVKKDASGVRSLIDEEYAALKEDAENIRMEMQAYLSEAFDFSDSKYRVMNDGLKSVLYDTVGGMDESFLRKIMEDGTSAKEYIDSMLVEFDKLSAQDSKTLTAALDLQTKFNDGEVSYGEYTDGIAKAANIIDGMNIDDEIKKQIKLSFDAEGAKEDYDATLENLMKKGMDKEVAEKLLKSLNSTELSAAIKIIADPKVDLKDPGKLYEDIAKQAKIDKAMKYTIDTDAEAAGLEKLNAALSESRSAAGLNAESMAAIEDRYSSLRGYDAAELFQETANGISLNTKELNEMERALSDKKLKEITDNTETLKDRYYELGEEIAKCTNESEKMELISEREQIRAKIANLGELATIYEGLTSSYSEWQRAESAGNNRDLYSNVFSAQAEIKKELDNGWIDDGTREYFQLIWGEDKWDGAGKSIQDYRAKWNTLGETIEGTSYSINDFFKTNSEGELTSQGIFNFFDAVGQKQKELGKDWIQYGEHGEIKSFNFGVDGDKAIAEALGISEELVQIFLRASQDAGFVVNFDGTYTQLADLQNEAKAAMNTFNDIFESDYSFNFNAKTVTDAESALAEAKSVFAEKGIWDAEGNFNVEAKGAQEAMTVVSALQANLDTLDDKYINIKVADTELQEPLAKVQEYERNANYLNQLKLNPKVNAAKIEETNKKLDETVQYLHDLPDEQKVKIGIDTNATPEEIRSQVETGTLTFDAAIDIQTSMDSSLQDLRDLAMLNSGLLTKEQEEEILIRLGVKVEADEPDVGPVKKTVEGSINELEDGSVIENPDFVVKANAKIEAGDIDGNGVVTGAEKKISEIKGNISEQTVDGKVHVNVKTADIDCDGTVSETEEKLVEAFLGADIEVDLPIDVTTRFLEENQELKDWFDGAGDEQKEIGVDFVYNNEEYLKNIESGKMPVLLEFATNNKEFLDSLESDKQRTLAYDCVINNEDLLDKVTDPELKNNVIRFYAEGDGELLDSLSGDQEKQTAMVNFVAENPDFFDKYTGESKKVAFEFAANNLDFLNSFDTIEEKQLAIDVVVNNQELLSQYETPEAQQRVISFIVANPDVFNQYEDPIERDIVFDYVSENGAEAWEALGEDGQKEYLEKEVKVRAEAIIEDGGDISEKLKEKYNIDETIDASVKVKPVAESGSTELDGEFTATAEVTGEAANSDLGGEFTGTAEVTGEPSNSALGQVFSGIASVLGTPAFSALGQVFSGIASVLGVPALSVLGQVFSGTASVTGIPSPAALGQAFYGTASVTGVPVNSVIQAPFTATGQATMTPETTNMGSGFSGSGLVSMLPSSYNMGGGFYGTGTVTITKNYVEGANAPANGTAHASGTAHVGGTAFADGTKKNRHKQGDWRIGSSGVALGGELGQEIVVRDGKFFTIGDRGAEFFKHEPGDIIFNHRQTEELFKNGYVTSGGGRGRAFAEGTAFSSGTGAANPWGKPSGGGGGGGGSYNSNNNNNNTYNYNYNGSSGSSNSASDAAEEAEEKFEETIDWIEIAIDRVERAIKHLDTIASSTYKTWGKRNSALADQIGEVRSEIDLQQRAYDRYMQQASSIGLSESYASQVRDGSINIELITDEDLKEKIDDYQEWYEKALDCRDAIEELNETVSELYEQKFDNVKAEFEGYLSVFEHEQNILEELINQSEARGHLVSKEFYKALSESQTNSIAELQKEKEALLAELDNGVNSGYIEKYSEAW